MENEPDSVVLTDNSENATHYIPVPGIFRNLKDKDNSKVVQSYITLKSGQSIQYNVVLNWRKTSFRENLGFTNF